MSNSCVLHITVSVTVGTLRPCITGLVEPCSFVDDCRRFGGTYPSSTLQIEAIRSSETLGTAWPHNTGDRKLYFHHHEKLRFQINLPVIDWRSSHQLLWTS